MAQSPPSVDQPVALENHCEVIPTASGNARPVPPIFGTNYQREIAEERKFSTLTTSTVDDHSSFVENFFISHEIICTIGENELD